MQPLRGPAAQKNVAVAVGSRTVAGVIGPASSIEDVTWLMGSSGLESGASAPVSPNNPPGTTWAGPPNIWPLVGVTITSGLLENPMRTGPSETKSTVSGL